MAALEEKVHKAEADGQREQAISFLHELLSCTAGRDAYQLRAMEWRSDVKRLQAELVDVKKLDAQFDAFEKEAASVKPADARALLLRLTRFQDAVKGAKRPWLKRLEELRKAVELLVPKGPPTWQEVRDRIVKTRLLDQRGRADWGGALRDWKDYLRLELPAEDRKGAENAMKAVEQKAKEEVASLKGRNLPPEELKKQRLRFEGTQAAPDLDRAIEGK